MIHHGTAPRPVSTAHGPPRREGGRRCQPALRYSVTARPLRRSARVSSHLEMRMKPMHTVAALAASALLLWGSAQAAPEQPEATEGIPVIILELQPTDPG